MLVICNKREMDSGVSECLADMFSSAKIRPKLVRRFTQSYTVLDYIELVWLPPSFLLDELWR